MIGCWKLHHVCGYSIRETAELMGVCEATVKNWVRKVKDCTSDLDTVQAAQDAVKAMIPAGLRVLWRQITQNNDEWLARAAAHDVLVSQRVLTERTEISFADADDDELVKEAESILDIARKRPAVARARKASAPNK